MSTSIYKLVLIGDGGVGKTTLLKRLSTGEFTRKYVPTFGTEAHPLIFNTTTGSKIHFNVWDIAGIRDSCYVDADCAIVMFSRTSIISWKNIQQLIVDFKRMCPNAPIVLCGNKVDVTEEIVVSNGDISNAIHTSGNPLYNFQYYDISTKSNYNYEKPFLHLARILAGDLNLYFV